jgi:hypothetical protein
MNQAGEMVHGTGKRGLERSKLVTLSGLFCHQGRRKKYKSMEGKEKRLKEFKQGRVRGSR